MQKTISIQNMIFEIRGHKVMIDHDLAGLYEVEPKVLNQAVKRNIDRFPADFMFQLTQDEWKILRSQIVTSSDSHGGRRYAPYVFTVQGVAMLATVLNSHNALIGQMHERQGASLFFMPASIPQAVLRSGL